MKPDWKDAPDWARWLAQDAHGPWFWFENRPRKCTRVWDARGRIEWATTDSKPWTETLEERPQ